MIHYTLKIVNNLFISVLGALGIFTLSSYSQMSGIESMLVAFLIASTISMKLTYSMAKKYIREQEADKQ